MGCDMFLTKDNQIKWKKMDVAALVTLILVLLGIFWFDKPVFVFMRNFNCGLWDFFNVMFSGKVWLLVSFVAACILFIKKYSKSEVSFKNGVRDIFNKTKNSHAFLIFYSVLSACVLVKVLKTIIGRARPIFFEALDMTGFFPPSLDWAFNSMPSGHTTISFAGLVMIGMLAPRYKGFTWTLAVFIGLSRVAYGAHWPSDVIFGAFIGMVIADVVKSKMLKKSK